MNNSDEIFSNYKLARYFYGRGEYEQTRCYLEAVLDQTHPRDEHARQLYCEYSLCLYKLGECAEALAKVEQGVAQYPDCRELFYLKGQVFYEMGLLHHSRDYFSKFINIKTSFLNYKDGLAVNYKAYGYLTAIAVREGKYEDALYYLRLFVIEKPDINTLNNLGLLLLKTVIDKDTVIEILEASNLFSEQALVQMLLTSREYGACLDAIKHLGKENQFHAELMQCQLYLGRFNQVEKLINRMIPLIPMDGDIVKYYCIARWLETPRQSSRDFLLKIDGDLAEVQACLWIEELIFDDIDSPFEKTDITIDNIIKEIALTIYLLSDTCLGFDIIQNYFSCTRKEAYNQLGREAFDKGFFLESKTLLERSLNGENEKAEDYYKLGIACGGFGIYEQALEYFLRATALNSENHVYPCLVYEVLAIQEIEILVKKLDSFMENNILINELLRLCTLKCKSKRVRQIIEQEGNIGKGAAGIYNHFDRWSLVDDVIEEAVWNVND